MKRSDVQSILASRIPFGISGARTDVSSFSNGFNDAFSKKGSDEGQYVTRTDINGVFNAGAHHIWSLAVGKHQALVKETAGIIGGYPHLAQLVDSDGQRIISLKDNNFGDSVDFGKWRRKGFWSYTRDPEHWRRLHETEWFDVSHSIVTKTASFNNVSLLDGSDEWSAFIGKPQNSEIQYVLFSKQFPRTQSVQVYSRPVNELSPCGTLSTNLAFDPSVSEMAPAAMSHYGTFLPSGAIFLSDDFSIGNEDGAIVSGFEDFLPIRTCDVFPQHQYSYPLASNSVEYYLLPKSKRPNSAVNRMTEDSFVKSSACPPLGYSLAFTNEYGGSYISKSQFYPDNPVEVQPGYYFIAVKFNGPVVGTNDGSGTIELKLSAPFRQHPNALASNRKPMPKLG